MLQRKGLEGDQLMTKNFRLEEIEAQMLMSFAENSFSDTPDNRIAWLEGLRDGWVEEKPKRGEDVFERSLYLLAINTGISILKMQKSLRQFHVH